LALLDMVATVTSLTKGLQSVKWIVS
jgi:hypothetical protein